MRRFVLNVARYVERVAGDGVIAVPHAVTGQKSRD